MRFVVLKLRKAALLSELALVHAVWERLIKFVKRRTLTVIRWIKLLTKSLGYWVELRFEDSLESSPSKWTFGALILQLEL